MLWGVYTIANDSELNLDRIILTLKNNFCIVLVGIIFVKIFKSIKISQYVIGVKKNLHIFLSVAMPFDEADNNKSCGRSFWFLFFSPVLALLVQPPEPPGSDICKLRQRRLRPRQLLRHYRITGFWRLTVCRRNYIFHLTLLFALFDVTSKIAKISKIQCKIQFDMIGTCR